LDMVLVVNRWLIVVFCVKKYGTFVLSSQKKVRTNPQLCPHVETCRSKLRAKVWVCNL
jgi:hypothetical protein